MKEETYNKILNAEITKRTSCMNNTKWKYLFKKINALNYDYSVQVKRLLADELEHFFIPELKHFILYNGEEYLDNANYSGIRLKEIEYIFIPNKIIYERNHNNQVLQSKIQPIDKLIKCLQTTGKQIEYEIAENGVFIYGYK